MSSFSYTCTEEQKKQFAAVYLLDRMSRLRYSPPLYLEDTDQDLEPVLEYAMVKNYIQISNSEKYVLTEKGHSVLHRFTKRYKEYLTKFDIFCAVDLTEGDFAFAHSEEFTDERAWSSFLADDRWEDLRIAVTQYKKLDPVEIVFMSFINEGRFGYSDAGWQFDLILGSVWDDMLAICNSALTVESLAYTDDDGVTVSGEQVIEDVIIQGTELNAQIAENAAAQSGDDRVAEFTDEDFEPEYIAPCWREPLFS